MDSQLCNEPDPACTMGRVLSSFLYNRPRQASLKASNQKRLQLRVEAKSDYYKLAETIKQVEVYFQTNS